MNVQDLHESLRREVLRRIDSGELTGTRLAQQTGFRQAHISNFLTKKRALSLDGLDRVLAAQELTVDQLLPLDVAAASETSGKMSEFRDEEIVMVPIVSATQAAAAEQIAPTAVVESLPVASARLAEFRGRPSRHSSTWQRFVALRLDAQQAAAMEPFLTAGTIAVIDRHYNSLAPYRAHQPTLYAVRHGGDLLVRYVEFDDGRLILRPSAIGCGVQLIAVGTAEAASEAIVGRICLVMYDL